MLGLLHSLVIGGTVAGASVSERVIGHLVMLVGAKVGESLPAAANLHASVS